MLQRTALLLFPAWLASAALAQGDLAVGGTAAYAPTAGAGVGAELRYRHTLGAHWDLTAGLGGVFYTGLGQQPGHPDRRAYPDPAFGFLGAGLDYRTQREGPGFAFGLMPGAVYAPYWNDLGAARYGFAPAARLSLDYRFNERLALGLENTVYQAPRDAGMGRFRQMPTLRLKVRAGEG